jgi:hypothetical protein
MKLGLNAMVKKLSLQFLKRLKQQHYLKDILLQCLLYLQKFQNLQLNNHEFDKCIIAQFRLGFFIYLMSKITQVKQAKNG